MKTRALLINLITLIGITLLVFQSCKKDAEKTNQLPTCNITAPIDNFEVHIGETVIISVEAEDNGGSIAEVRFAIDGIGVSSVLNYPYNYTWVTTNENIGIHTVKATSIDNEGGSTSDEINISLLEDGGGNTPPTANWNYFISFSVL